MDNLFNSSNNPVETVDEEKNRQEKYPDQIPELNPELKYCKKYPD